MIKPNQTSANVNVLAENDLTQVVGGCGYRNYRPRRHHCWGWRRRYDSGHEGSFEGRGPSDDSFESEAPEFDPSTSSDDTTDAAPVV